nr:hypothetical protein [Tanacetum cinerariifolium]
MDSIMDEVIWLMIEVKREEKVVKEAKEEAIKSGFNILEKMDEHKQAHVKEIKCRLHEQVIRTGYTYRQYTRITRIAQSSVLPPVADEPASPLGDGSQGEACPTDSGFVADQDRANTAKTSTLPSDSAPRVTSLAADEGSMQQKLDELTALCVTPPKMRVAAEYCTGALLHNITAT